MGWLDEDSKMHQQVITIYVLDYLFGEFYLYAGCGIEAWQNALLFLNNH